MRDFVEFVVKSIVTNPQDVEVTEEKLEETVLKVSISVNEADMGILIGKGGKTINSIRSLARAKAITDNVKVFVETC